MTWLNLFASFALIVATVLLLAAAWELRRILAAQVPIQVNQVAVGQAALSTTQAAIPRIIWAYWHQAALPDFIAQCQSNWQHFAPDHEIRLLHQANVRDWLQSSELLERLESLPVYRQADWLRLQLLAKYGGLWIDASILLCQSLAWVHQTQQERRSEFVGFYIDRFTTNLNQPIVENWFMATPAASPFVLDLAAEFDLAITLGEDEYLKELDRQGIRQRVVQGLGPKDQTYLIMHVAAAVVLDRKPHAYRLTLTRAEDSALGFHAALGWRKRHLFARLAMTRSPSRLPVLIKLRGGDRRVFEQGIARKKVRPNSALARLLPPFKSHA